MKKFFSACLVSSVMLGSFGGGAFAEMSTKASAPVVHESCHSGKEGVCKHGCNHAKGFAPVTVGSLSFTEGSIRPTAASEVPTAAYLTVTNRSGADEQLIKIASSASASAALHNTMVDVQGVMKMAEITEGVKIKSGESFSFKPRAAHLMLIGVKEQIKPGALIPVDFYFKNAGKITLSLPAVGMKGADKKSCCCHGKDEKAKP